MSKVEDNNTPNSKFPNQVSKPAPFEFEPRLQSQQFDDFKRLLSDDKYSDFKLIIANVEFPVHRCILAARSPVFALIFEENARDSKDHIIHITDVRAEVMREMLRFIYTGKTNDIKNMAGELLVAAFKYELDDLLAYCEGILIDGLCLETISDVLTVTDKANAERLKSAAIDYVIDNSETLNNSVKFGKKLEALSTSILVDLARSLMARLSVEINGKLTG